MKKLLMLIVIVLLGSSSIAQENSNKLYLIFEFMEVDGEQETAYLETEEFWHKIHEQRVKNGDIIGWDLWSLRPGGENQKFQYLTVNLYDDPVKMFAESGDYQAALNAAYPDMPKDEIKRKFDATSKTRNLAVRYFLEQIDGTVDDFQIPIGTLAVINLMKVDQANYGAYEKMEGDIFKPMHQNEVDNDKRESWGLLRFMAPYGSDTYASHITVDMYKDFNQYFEPDDEEPEMSETQVQAMNDGLETRDMKYVYLATLIKKAR